MLRDTWRNRREAQLADHLRSALDVTGITLKPGEERRLIIELYEILEAENWGTR